MSRRTYRSSGKGALVSHRCHLEFIDLIREKLDIKNMQKMMNSCFGQLFLLPDIKFQGQLFNVLLRHLDKKSMKQNRLTFLLGGRSLDFTPLDFALITGLKFNGWVELPVESETHRILFREKHSIRLEEIVEKFKHECRVSEGSSNMCFKIACLMLLFGVYLCTGTSPNMYIDMTYFHLIDDMELFMSFPWGKVAYNYLVTRTHKAKDTLDNILRYHRKLAFDAHCFVIALQVWAYEVIPIIGRNCASPIEGSKHLIPRIRRWTASKSMKFDLLSRYITKLSAKSLTPMIVCECEEDFIKVSGVLDIKDGLADHDAPITNDAHENLNNINTGKQHAEGEELHVDGGLLRRVADLERCLMLLNQCKKPIEDVSGGELMGVRLTSLDQSPTKDKKLVNQALNDDVGMGFSGIRATSLDQSTSKDIKLGKRRKLEKNIDVAAPIPSRRMRLRSASKCQIEMTDETIAKDVLGKVEKKKTQKLGVRKHATRSAAKSELNQEDVYNIGSEDRLDVEDIAMAFPRRYDPNELDFIKGPVIEFVEWRKIAENDDLRGRLNLPFIRVGIVDPGWFDPIWNRRGWLDTLHIDTIINLIVLTAKNEPYKFLQGWSVMDLFCWSALTGNNFRLICDRVGPFVSGIQPHSRPIHWNRVDKVYGIGNVNDNHWVCYKVDLDAKCLTVYDSLSQSSSWENLLQIFNKVCQNIATVCTHLNLWEFKGEEAPDAVEWKVVSYRHPPQQTNGADCGIMALKMMECLATGFPIDELDASRCGVFRHYYCGKLFAIGKITDEAPITIG